MFNTVFLHMNDDVVNVQRELIFMNDDVVNVQTELILFGLPFILVGSI